MLKRMKPAGKRKASQQREEKLKAIAPDQAWSMDFVSDQLQDGTRFRSLTIVDVFTREAVAIDAGQSLKGEDVVRTLNRLKSSRGVPKVLFCDNGTRGVADKQHGAWRSGNRYALPTSPHPRRRLLELRNSCATLTQPTAQKIGHSSRVRYESHSRRSGRQTPGFWSQIS